MGEQEGITTAEAALYDRQIRLWGLDAQRRLRAANVLLVGLRGLGAEVAKNIVLAGINSLTLLDDTEVSDEDACSQFLFKRDDIGKNRAVSSLARTQQLNPLVEIKADGDKLEDKNEDFFCQFDVICVTNCSSTQMVRINHICHNKGIQFFAGDVYGYFGFMFTDLGDHEYVMETFKPIKQNIGSGEPPSKKTKVEDQEKVMTKCTEKFTTLQAALDVDWTKEPHCSTKKKTPTAYFITKVLFEFLTSEKRRPLAVKSAEDCEKLCQLKSKVVEKCGLNKDLISDELLSHCFAELSPVCAITGGVLSQEIIKAVSRKDKPHNNFFFYNGVEGSAIVDQIGA